MSKSKKSKILTKTEEFVNKVANKGNPQKDKDLEKRKEGFTKGLDALRKEYRLDFVPTMDFVEYKVIPDEISLAILILNKHKMRYIYNLVEIKEESKNDN